MPNNQEMEESSAAMSNTTGSFAFARNNNWQLSQKRDNPHKPYTTPAEAMEASEAGTGGEGRNFVAFLTNEEEAGGEFYPIDYEKEYFGTLKDAKEYIDQMTKETALDSAHEKKGGFVVPASKEKEAEQHLNDVINTGDSSRDKELPKSDSDREGAYWTESAIGNQVDAYYDALDQILAKGSYSYKEMIGYLMKNFNLEEMEANAVLSSYQASNPKLTEIQLTETTSNLAVINAFISGSSKPIKSVNLKIQNFVGGLGLINYYTILALTTHSNEAFFNYEKYSITTSKIQGGLQWRLKQAYGSHFHMCNEEEIKSLAEGKEVLEFKPVPDLYKQKTKKYNKLPSNPNYMQNKPYGATEHLSPEEDDTPEEPVDPFEGDEMFKDEE